MCDSVSVLRDGGVVAEGVIAEFTEQDLIRAIVGKDIGDMYPPVPMVRSMPVALAAHNIHGDILRGVSLEIHEGEVVGLTGLAGMGHDELPELLYGARRLRSGEIRLFGEFHAPAPQTSIARGMIMLPADRKVFGGDAASTVADNLTLPIVKRYFRAGRVDRAAVARDSARVLHEFDVRPPDPWRLLGELSGGNQQKALLAKWLSLFGKARVLLLHEATQGVDVGARQEIFRLIRESASKGIAILYVSTEYEDLAHLCDRVIIVRYGQVVDELDRTNLSAASIAARALASDFLTNGIVATQATDAK